MSNTIRDTWGKPTRRQSRWHYSRDLLLAAVAGLVFWSAILGAWLWAESQRYPNIEVSQHE